MITLGIFAHSKWFHKLNHEEDFPKIAELFEPLMHIILLIWKNGKHYSTPARLVALTREICDSLIALATRYISGEQIIAMIENEEAPVAVNMLKTTIYSMLSNQCTLITKRQPTKSAQPIRGKFKTTLSFIV